MPREVLGLVTLFHPDVYYTDLLALPHRKQLRREKTQAMKALELAGRIHLKPAFRSVPMVDGGEEKKQFRHKMIPGSSLIPVLAEPRIINVRDEPNPKAKWKIEFKKNWPDEIGRLDQTHIQLLLSQISKSTLKIKGLWINRTVNMSKWQNAQWINLVLVALKAEEPGAQAPLHFSRDTDRAYVDWET